jgi:uncharacterized DUF497 family protein
MAITFDPAKREWILRERSLDFLDAAEVFTGPKIDFEDVRRDYGEVRLVTVGLLRGRMVVVCWTPRDGDRHVFSMRKANAKEQKRHGPKLV